MKDFIIAIRCFIVEVLVRSGLSVVERDFRDALQWEKDEFRDDEDINQVELEIKKAAQKHADKIVQILLDRGFKTETDMIERKEELSSVLANIIQDFDSDLRGRVI